MKKNTKWILGIITVIIIAIAVIWSSFYYVTNYKKTICDMSASSDGKYELSLLAVGEPEWPFGSATGQLIRKRKIARLVSLPRLCQTLISRKNY